MIYNSDSDRTSVHDYMKSYLFMPRCGESLTFEQTDWTTTYWATPESNYAFKLYYKIQDEHIWKIKNSVRFEVIINRPYFYSRGVDQLPDLMNCNVSQLLSRIELRELDYKALRKKVGDGVVRVREIHLENQLNEACRYLRSDHDIKRPPVALLVDETEQFRRLLLDDTKFIDFLIY